MTRAKTKSIADIFFDFIRDNPRAAAALAFELGIWAGNSTDSLAKFKKMAQASPKLLLAARQSMSDAAQKLLPHPSPSLQPDRPAKRRKRSKGRRKPV